MTFSIKAVLADADLPPFEYEDADGELCELPHAKLLTSSQSLRLALEGDIEGVLNELEPGVGTALMDLPTVAAEALVKAWLEHSEVDFSGGAMGKAPGSSRPSSTRRTPSKRTSRSAASRSRK